MPGKLGKNLRSGHKAEDLGILFLKNFCACVQVKQEEDIGIDAVATLLKEQRGMLYAEDTFFAQIKSKSVAQITYENEELEWLINQDLPIFIISVDRIGDEIKIYTSNAAYQIIGYRGFNKLQLNLTDDEQEYFKRAEVIENTISIDIGPPIIISSFEASKDNEEQNRLYSLLKIWTQEEHKQTQMRKLGFSKVARWSTGDMPDYYLSIVNTHSSNIVRDLTAAKPFFEYLSNHIELGSADEEYKKELMRQLRTWYAEHDIDINLNIDKNIIHSDGNQVIYTN